MLDPAAVRPQFPALQRQVNGRTPVFLDGPGGTQVPQVVIDERPIGGYDELYAMEQSGELDRLIGASGDAA